MVAKTNWVDINTAGHTAPDWTFNAADMNALGAEVNAVAAASVVLSVDGTPITSYDFDTTPPTASDVGAYSTAETDAAIAAAVATVNSKVEYLRIGHGTGNTTTTDDGKWTAIGLISLAAQYDTALLAGKITDGSGGNPNSYMKFRVYVKQNAAMNSDPDVTLTVSEVAGFDINSLVAVVTTKTVSATVVTLYGKIVHEYEQWSIVPDMEINDANAAFQDFQPFITSLPAGTQTLASQLTATEVAPPATASSAGSIGQIAYDANYLYRCVAANTWKRSALSTW